MDIFNRRGVRRILLLLIVIALFVNKDFVLYGLGGHTEVIPEKSTIILDKPKTKLETVDTEQEEVIYEDEQIIRSNADDKAVTKDIKVCSTSSVKTYMSYGAITSKSSKQYQYIHNNTVIKDGFLWDGEYMAVALGSYFKEIGTKYIFTLDTGIELKVVKAEAKSDSHTNEGCEQRWDKSVLEVLVDTKTTQVWRGKNGYLANGNFNNLKEFKGKIIKIEKVEE